MNIGTVWQQAADKWNEVVAQVGDDQRDAPCTSCPEWTVGELIDPRLRGVDQGLGVEVPVVVLEKGLDGRLIGHGESSRGRPGRAAAMVPEGRLRTSGAALLRVVALR